MANTTTTIHKCYFNGNGQDERKWIKEIRRKSNS